MNGLGLGYLPNGSSVLDIPLEMQFTIRFEKIRKRNLKVEPLPFLRCVKFATAFQIISKKSLLIACAINPPSIP